MREGNREDEDFHRKGAWLTHVDFFFVLLRGGGAGKKYRYREAVRHNPIFFATGINDQTSKRYNDRILKILIHIIFQKKNMYTYKKEIPK